MTQYIVTKGDITLRTKNVPVIRDAVLIECYTGAKIAASFAMDVFNVNSNDRLHVYEVNPDSLKASGVVVFRPQSIDFDLALRELKRHDNDY